MVLNNCRIFTLLLFIAFTVLQELNNKRSQHITHDYMFLCLFCVFASTVQLSFKLTRFDHLIRRSVHRHILCTFPLINKDTILVTFAARHRRGTY
jgi:hypothetical protein